MRKFFAGSWLLFSLTISQLSCGQSLNTSEAYRNAEAQTRLLLKTVQQQHSVNSQEVSPRTEEKGQLKMVPARDWTSGFFPGMLWMWYEYTGKKEWKAEAEKYTAFLEQEKNNAGTHDMGFKIYCSYGTGYRITGDEHYRQVIIQAAQTLSTRFNPVTGVIRSWDHHRQQWQYPVIIDNMMNLELLFAATQLTGDSSYYQIAVRHANQTLANHYRPDFSSYHVVDYDTLSGKVISRGTHQGFADYSAWARGQAWGLYGFTMCYRFTRKAIYLQQADSIASFLLLHPRLPADDIPYWDFDAPQIPHEERDASAAAVMASALLELSEYSRQSTTYRNAASHMLKSLATRYTAPPESHHGFILLHSTGSKPSNSEVDVPIIYADYYYLEALLRFRMLQKNKRE